MRAATIKITHPAWEALLNPGGFLDLHLRPFRVINIHPV
jgi:hypothetical protein